MFKITEYFSFYVLLWYFYDIIPFNPIIIFYLILSFACFMLYNNLSIKILFYIIFEIILIKVLPILTLKHEFNTKDLAFGL